MVRFNKSCEAELINDYECEAQNNKVKIGFLLLTNAKTITKTFHF